MSPARIALWLAAPLVFLASPCLADFSVSADVTCPASASAGTTITADLALASEQCTAVNVRFVSSIAGNVDQTFGGIGVFGPVVADDTLVVPAATDLLPGTCGTIQANRCDGASFFCQTNADCVCREVIPGVANASLATPPVLPASLVGTVASYILVTEWDDGTETTTDIDHCMVDVLP